jgi:hypothetical protein
MTSLKLQGNVDESVKEVQSLFDGLVPPSILCPKLLQRPPFALLRALVVSFAIHLRSARIHLVPFHYVTPYGWIQREELITGCREYVA